MTEPVTGAPAAPEANARAQTPGSPTPESQTPAALPPESLLPPPPGEDAAPLGDLAREEATGTPPTYEPFQLPQGVEVDLTALEEAQSLFAEARLSQPQAQKLVDLYAGKMNELVQRQISAAESRQTAWVAEVKNDPELGGRRFEQARAAAQKALSRFGTPELRRTLDELWVGNNPQLFRFFARVGQALSEDRYVGARSGGAATAADTLYPHQNKE